MNYRKFYEEQLNIKLSKDFDIHHIDYNHSNNSLDNLVALPHKLHQRLHQAYNEYIRDVDYIKLKDIKLYSGSVGPTSKSLNDLYEYLSVINECVPYMNAKEMRLLYGKSR